MNRRYALVTPAYNEEKYIETTIKSIVAQTQLPVKWVIVSDGSTDGTDDIVKQYAAKYPFIELYRITEDHPRNFSAQVNAINTGYAQMKNVEFEFFGNVDADVEFPPNYYETLIQRFEADQSLGLIGGYIWEDYGAGFHDRRTNNPEAVSNSIQLFRRGIYDDIGGYHAVKYGGQDWVAEVMVRMRGWTVRAYADLPVMHYRPAASHGGWVRGWYRQGMMDYSLGSVGLFEIVKCTRRLVEPPYVLGAMARMTAFIYSFLTRQPRLVPEDFVCALRREQKQRLKALLGIKTPETPAPSKPRANTASAR